jgi:hypothetical protein
VYFVKNTFSTGSNDSSFWRDWRVSTFRLSPDCDRFYLCVVFRVNFLVLHSQLRRHAQLTSITKFFAGIKKIFEVAFFHSAKGKGCKIDSISIITSWGIMSCVELGSQSWMLNTLLEWKTVIVDRNSFKFCKKIWRLSVPFFHWLVSPVAREHGSGIR